MICKFETNNNLRNRKVEFYRYEWVAIYFCYLLEGKAQENVGFHTMFMHLFLLKDLFYKMH